jgi:hypothetical protein
MQGSRSGLALIAGLAALLAAAVAATALLGHDSPATGNEPADEGDEADGAELRLPLESGTELSLAAVARLPQSWPVSELIAGVAGGTPPYLLRGAEVSSGSVAVVEVAGVQRVEFTGAEAGSAVLTLAVTDAESAETEVTGEIAVAPALSVNDGELEAPADQPAVSAEDLIFLAEGGTPPYRLAAVAGEEGVAALIVAEGGRDMVRLYPGPGAEPFKEGDRLRFSFIIAGQRGSQAKGHAVVMLTAPSVLPPEEVPAP